MVSRRLNRPAYKVKNIPIFWLHELAKSSWRCRNCMEEQTPPSVCFEVMYRDAKKGKKGATSSARKMYLCMDCAKDLLSVSLDKVKIIKTHGKDGLSLFDEI